MEIENHKEEVPFAHYQELFAAADPQEILGRLPGISFDGKELSVTLLGKKCFVSFPEGSFRTEDGSALPLPTQTFLLRYLLESRELSWDGSWKTFREMPWGEMYIKPYTGRVLSRAAFTFGTRVAKFRDACEKMGAVPLKHGDAGYQFDFIGPYGMQILVWEGDDEFPPNAQVLYSANFSEGFAPEDRVVAGDILISTIKANL